MATIAVLAIVEDSDSERLTRLCDRSGLAVGDIVAQLIHAGLPDFEQRLNPSDLPISQTPAHRPVFNL